MTRREPHYILKTIEDAYIRHHRSQKEDEKEEEEEEGGGGRRKDEEEKECALPTARRRRGKTRSMIPYNRFAGCTSAQVWGVQEGGTFSKWRRRKEEETEEDEEGRRL